MDELIRYPCQVDWLVLWCMHFSIAGRPADDEERGVLLRH
jgi:hypothetical protein